MLRYSWSRLLWAIPLVLAAIVATFLLTHVLPGDVTTALVGDYPAPQAYVEEIRHEFGLDKPLVVQLELYLQHLLSGDLGYSFANQQPVARLIFSRATFTLLLVIPGLVLATVSGVILAVSAAPRAGSSYDALLAAVGLFGYSVPVFWLAQILIVVFAVGLGVLPAQGFVSLRASNQGFGVVLDVIRHAVLPTFCLVIYYWAVVMRVGRASIVEALTQDFVLTARAKGLSGRAVLWRHALPNAIGPVLTVVGFQFSYALTGAILVETVFAWPGIGRLFVDSISRRDYPVLEGTFLLTALSVVAVNLATDIVHALLDPRARASYVSDR